MKKGIEIKERKEGDFILDLRLVEVTNTKGGLLSEKTIMVGKEKLSFRAKIPNSEAQRIYNELKLSFKQLVGEVGK